MYRLIFEKLKEWKRKDDKDRKPLIVIGARQVGKTYSVRDFAKKEYNGCIEINFQEDARARRFFEQPQSVDDIITYLELNFSTPKTNRGSLVFFDEIQLCPELITSLKFLKSKLESDIICSGSMLGVSISHTPSWPVGYVEMIKMHPMSFTEFTIAAGIDPKYTDTIRECIADMKEIPEALHERMLRLWTDYMICGGLPEAVSAYTENGLSASIAVNRRLANDYRIDIAHYADSKTKIKAQECFDSIHLQLAKENKKFQYNLVRKGYNARHYEESLNWLEEAGMAIKTYRLSRIGVPMEIFRELNVFKLYFFNTGLLVSQFPDSDIYEFASNTLNTYKGVLYENAMAQVLEFLGIKSFYYEPNTSSEIDFIINTEDGITPIEVKSGLHTRAKSFTNFVSRHHPKAAYRFSRKNIGSDEGGIIQNLPFYTCEWAIGATGNMSGQFESLT